MKLTGLIEVFQNKKGYVTGVFKAWNEESKEVLGKAYLDVNLPESVKIKEGQTLTLNVKEGYLNAIFVDTENAFTKLKINIVDCEVKSVFPEPKKTKKEAK